MEDFIKRHCDTLEAVIEAQRVYNLFFNYGHRYIPNPQSNQLSLCVPIASIQTKEYRIIECGYRNRTLSLYKDILNAELKFLGVVDNDDESARIRTTVIEAVSAIRREDRDE